MLVVQVLGSARFALAGPPRPLQLPRQAMRLLAFLVLHRTREHGREELMERFWPNQPPARSRSALASAVCRLRHALPDEARGLLATAHDSPGLDRDAPISLDAESFARLVAPALAWDAPLLPAAMRVRLEEGLALYHGDLLSGWYEDWVLPERERLRILRLAALQRLLEDRAAAGEAEAALACGREILKQEPLHEEVHRRMMEILASRGDRTRALLLYRDLERRLAAELGVPPDPATQTLRARLLQGGEPARSPIRAGW